MKWISRVPLVGVRQMQSFVRASLMSRLLHKNGFRGPLQEHAANYERSAVRDSPEDLVKLPVAN